MATLGNIEIRRRDLIEGSMSMKGALEWKNLSCTPKLLIAIRWAVLPHHNFATMSILIKY